jgi:hypothetical protein
MTGRQDGDPASSVSGNPGRPDACRRPAVDDPVGRDLFDRGHEVRPEPAGHPGLSQQREELARSDPSGPALASSPESKAGTVDWGGSASTATWRSWLAGFWSWWLTRHPAGVSRRDLARAALDDRPA